MPEGLDSAVPRFDARTGAGEFLKRALDEVDRLARLRVTLSLKRKEMAKSTAAFCFSAMSRPNFPSISSHALDLFGTRRRYPANALRGRRPDLQRSAPIRSLQLHS